jgi:hypothetical protein
MRVRSHLTTRERSHLTMMERSHLTTMGRSHLTMEERRSPLARPRHPTTEERSHLTMMARSHLTPATKALPHPTEDASSSPPSGLHHLLQDLVMVYKQHFRKL